MGLPTNHNPRCKPNFYVYNFSYKCGPRLLFYEYTPSSSNPSNFFPDLPKKEKTNMMGKIKKRLSMKTQNFLKRKSKKEDGNESKNEADESKTEDEPEENKDAAATTTNED